MTSIRWWCRTGLVCGAGLALLGCGNDEPRAAQAAPPPVSTGIAPARRFIPVGSIPADSLGMGGLEGIAAQIARAIQEPALRARLADSMRRSSNKGLGVDLSACGGPSIAADLLRAGEAQGGRPAKELCASLTKTSYLLYMNVARLASWDGSEIPLVTANALPAQAPPRELKAFINPSMLYAVGDGRKVTNHMLVILPGRHPSRTGSVR